jgi:hypothetical protein
MHREARLKRQWAAAAFEAHDAMAATWDKSRDTAKSFYTIFLIVFIMYATEEELPHQQKILTPLIPKPLKMPMQRLLPFLPTGVLEAFKIKLPRDPA